MGWPQGILIDASTGTPTDLNIADSSLRIRNVTLAGNTINFKYSASGSAPTGANDASITTWFSNAYYNNDLLTNASDAKLIAPFNYIAPDPTPFGSPTAGNIKILTGGSFDDPRFAGDTFFDKTVTFRGAIAPAGELSTWWKGWTKFNYGQ
jgi:hypothetical protein